MPLWPFALLANLRFLIIFSGSSTRGRRGEVDLYSVVFLLLFYNLIIIILNFFCKRIINVIQLFTFLYGIGCEGVLMMTDEWNFGQNQTVALDLVRSIIQYRLVAIFFTW